MSHLKIKSFKKTPKLVSVHNILSLVRLRLETKFEHMITYLITTNR